MAKTKFRFNPITGNLDISSVDEGPPGGQDFHVARFIVGDLDSGANYPDLATAYAAAVLSTGKQTVFIQPGSYTIGTQDLSPSVNIAALDCDAPNQNVYLLGKFTASFNGSCSISGISVETNTDNILEISGANTTILYFDTCTFIGSNATPFLNNSPGGNIIFSNCGGGVGETQTWFTFNGGNVAARRSTFGSANSMVPSVFTNANVNFQNSYVGCPIQTEGAASFASEYSDHIVLNMTNVIHNGTGNSFLFFSRLESGTATAMTIGAGAAIPMMGCSIYSSNSEAISGAGSISYGQNDFYGPSSNVTVATQVPLPSIMGTLKLLNALGPTYGGTGLNDSGAMGNVLTAVGDGTWTSSPGGGGTPTAAIGSMQYFANAGGDSTLTSLGWLKCDGSILDQATYPDLFAQVGLLNPPGRYWLNAISNTTTGLSAVAGGVGRYVAVGPSGLILTSTDAKTWARSPSPQASGLLGITYGALFVMTGGSGIFVTSTDGISFDTRLPSLAIQPNSLIYTTKYVGIGSSNVLFTSTNGTLFTGRDGKFLDAMNGANAIAFGNSLYVIGGLQGFLATSTDAITWARQTAPTTSNIQAITYGSIYAIGGVGGFIKTSTNAITWTTQTSGTTSTITAMAFCNSLYLFGCTGGGLSTSTDAVTWTSRTSNTTSTINSFTYGGVFVYGAGGGRIASSTDATTWTNRTSGTTSTINAMIFANSLYVFGANGGGISTSTDGTTWNARTSNLAANIQGLVWDGALFWAMCDSALATSTDAITWTARSTGMPIQTMIAVNYNGSLYLASGQVGAAATSTDGFTWVTQTTGTTQNFPCNTWGNGIWVLAGSTGSVFTSTDGVTYTARVSGTTTNYTGVTYDSTAALYLVVGGLGTTLSSTDAITWVQNTLFTLTGLTAATAANGNFYVTGQAGQIWTSTNAQTFTLATSPSTSSIVAINHYTNLVTVGAGGAIQYSPAAYGYDTVTQFQLPTDAGLGITQETIPNFARSLYIKAA